MVEDNEDLRELLTEILSGLGYRVLAVGNLRLVAGVDRVSSELENTSLGELRLAYPRSTVLAGNVNSWRCHG